MADLRDVRRWGRIGLRTVLRPLLYPFGGLAFGFAMVANVPISRWRDRRRYRAIAGALEAGQGRIVNRTYTPDAKFGPKLQVTSLHAGRWEDVLADVARRAGEIGYLVPDLDASADHFPRRLHMAALAQERLPILEMSVYSPGEAIEPSDVVVPEDRTGLRISLA